MQLSTLLDMLQRPEPRPSLDTLLVVMARLEQWHLPPHPSGGDDHPRALPHALELIERQLPSVIATADVHTGSSVMSYLAALRQHGHSCSETVLAAAADWFRGVARPEDPELDGRLLTSLLCSYALIACEPTAPAAPAPVAAAAVAPTASGTVAGATDASVAGEACPPSRWHDAAAAGRGDGDAAARSREAALSGPWASPAASDVLMGELARQLALQLRFNPGSASVAFCPLEDMAAVAQALALWQRRRRRPQPPQAPSGDPQKPGPTGAAAAAASAPLPPMPPPFAALLSAVSVEVIVLMSNRHSLTQPSFRAGDLVKLIAAYASLQHKDGEALRMLDTVAGHVAKRMRMRQEEAAMMAPHHIRDLLCAYARLRHVSIAVPELLAAAANTLAREAAAANERVQRGRGDAAAGATAGGRPAGQHGSVATTSNGTLGDDGSSGSSSGSSSSSKGFNSWPPAFPILDVQSRASAWEQFMSLQVAVDILGAYSSLGYHPGEPLLHSVMLAVTPQLQQHHQQSLQGADASGRASAAALASSDATAAAVKLLHLLAEFAHFPGAEAMPLLLAAAAAEARSPGGVCTSSRRLAATLCACQALGQPPGEALLALSREAACLQDAVATA